MDPKSIELYNEEQLQLLKDLQAGITSLADALTGKIAINVTNPDEVKVTGSVEVNTQDEVTIKNMGEFVAGLSTLQEMLQKTLEGLKPSDTVTVKNIQDAIAKELKVSNLSELTTDLQAIKQAIIDSQAIVNVTEKAIVWPRAAKDAIPVRLSDGKGWINQLIQGVAGGVAETDPLVGYQPCDIDEAGTPKYYGFAKNNGSWYIMRESSGAYRYSKGAPQFNGGGLYIDAWTDRANLTYDYIFEVFKK